MGNQNNFKLLLLIKKIELKNIGFGNKFIDNH